jgi:hypothetical protein
VDGEKLDLGGGDLLASVADDEGAIGEAAFDFDGGDDYEPIADTLLFEPLSYWLAIREGLTHVVCLRSWPDGLVEDPSQRGRGTEIAELVFPDKFLSYNPLVYTLRL